MLNLEKIPWTKKYADNHYYYSINDNKYISVYRSKRRYMARSVRNYLTHHCNVPHITQVIVGVKRPNVGKLILLDGWSYYV